MIKMEITGNKFSNVGFCESEFECSDICVNDGIMKVTVWGVIVFPELSYKTYKYLAGYAVVAFQGMVYAMVAGYDEQTKTHYIKAEWGDVDQGKMLNKCVLENELKYDSPDGMELYVIGDVIYYDEETNIDGGLLYIWCEDEVSLSYNSEELIDDKQYIHNVQKYKRPKK